MNTPVIDIRKELEALQEDLEQWPIDDGWGGQYLGPGHVMALKTRLRALLQRIPEGWELRPREISEKMIDAAYEAPVGVESGIVLDWVETPGGGEAREEEHYNRVMEAAWRAMRDACKENGHE